MSGARGGAGWGAACEMDAMSIAEKAELRTPPQRRLVKTDVPGVYRRGDRYVAITQYRGKRVKSYHRTKAEARRAKAQRTAGARPTSREPFERYAGRWLVEYRGRTARGLSPSTRGAYRLIFETYVIPFFRGRRIGDIGRRDVKEFIDHLVELEPRHRQHGATRLSGSTIRRIVAPLKAMLAEAYELEIIDTDAARVRVVVPGDVASQRPRTLTAAQIKTIIEHLGESDRLLFTLIARTGMRISEALGAHWGDVEHRAEGPVLVVRRQCCDGELRERTKTPAGMRSVALVPSLARALAVQRVASAFPGDDDPLFPTACGTHQDGHNVRRRLRPRRRRGWRPVGHATCLPPLARDRAPPPRLRSRRHRQDPRPPQRRDHAAHLHPRA